MKKLITLAGFAFAVALTLLPSPASARPTNAWNFKSLVLQSDQTLVVAGTATFTGAIFQSTQEALIPITTTYAATLVPISTGSQITVQLYTAGALGSAFGNCTASGTTIGAWVWPSTSSTASARPCN